MVLRPSYFRHPKYARLPLQCNVTLQSYVIGLTNISRTGCRWAHLHPSLLTKIMDKCQTCSKWITEPPVARASEKKLNTISGTIWTERMFSFSSCVFSLSCCGAISEALRIQLPLASQCEGPWLNSRATKPVAFITARTSAFIMVQ